jgi:hypothetical protein
MFKKHRKPHINLKKASISLEMPEKRIEILKITSNYFKNASISLKISEKCHAFFNKKASHSQKKPRESTPGRRIVLC